MQVKPSRLKTSRFDRTGSHQVLLNVFPQLTCVNQSKALAIPSNSKAPQLKPLTNNKIRVALQQLMELVPLDLTALGHLELLPSHQRHNNLNLNHTSRLWWAVHLLTNDRARCTWLAKPPPLQLKAIKNCSPLKRLWQNNRLTLRNRCHSSIRANNKCSPHQVRDQLLSSSYQKSLPRKRKEWVGKSSWGCVSLRLLDQPSQMMVKTWTWRTMKCSQRYSITSSPPLMASNSQL